MMENLLQLYITIVAVAGVLGIISVWAPRKLWVKIVAIAATTLFMPLAYASLTDLLSRPKPVSLEWAQRAAEEADVLGAEAQEGIAIHLWLKLDGAEEPRAYVLPWSTAMAEQLQRARGQAEENGGALRMRRPFEVGGDKDEMKFYAEPQPTPPAKNTAQNQATIYQHPSTQTEAD